MPRSRPAPLAVRPVPRRPHRPEPLHRADRSGRPGRHAAGRTVVGSVLLGTVLLVSGCAHAADAATPTPVAASSSAAPSTAPSTASSGPSPGPSNGGTAGHRRLTAKNGTDVDACRDGRCEIVVRRAPRQVPLDPRYRLGTFTVTRIGHGSVTFRSDGADGPPTRLDGAAGGRVSFGHLIVDVVRVRRHAAVLAFDVN